MTTIATARLLLPLLTLADCAHLDAGARQPEWAQDYPTDEDVMLARMLLAAGAETTDWGLRRVLLTDGTVVGGIGIFGPPDGQGRISLGYGFAVSARGLGYATEAVLAVTGWGGENGATVAAATPLTTNVKSQRVLERAGFTRTGEHETDEGLMFDYEKPLSRG